MSDIDYEKSLESPFPVFKKIYSDYSYFYFTISVCAIFFFFLILLNFVLGCCSDYSQYWNDRFTGNRWIASLWITSPKNQPPIDLTEINIHTKPHITVDQQHYYRTEHSYIGPHNAEEVYELTSSKRESAI